MNDLRSEADLRAALDELSADAPDVSVILPSADVPYSPRRLRWLAAAAAAVVVAAVAVAVALTRNNSTPPAGRPPTALVGIGWRLQSIGGHPVTGRPNPTFYIKPNGRFYQNRLGPCSSVLGRLTGTPTALRIEHARLSFGMCPALYPKPGPAVARNNAALRHVLTGTLSWTLDGDRLVLRKPGAPTLVYTRSPGSPAHVREWTYRGVGITLPATWPANAIRCGVPIQDTVILPGRPESTCQRARPSGVTSVELSGYRPGQPPLDFFRGKPSFVRSRPSERVIDGVTVVEQYARAPSGQYQGLWVWEIQFRSRGVAVTIASPSRTLAANLAYGRLYIVGR
jgi:heat shock protein HslJ